MINNTYFPTGLTYSRNTRSPLEDKKIFETEDDVLDYIRDPDQTGYIGQIVSVINNSDNTKNGLYYIDTVSMEIGDGLGSMHMITPNSEINKAQIDASFDLKADKSDTYTKYEVDIKITGGVDISTYYLTKLDASNTYVRINDVSILSSAIDENTNDILDLYNNKADVSIIYTKDYIDGSLDLKADKSDTYTKYDIDSSLDLKADKNNLYTISEIDGITTSIYNSIYVLSDDVSLNRTMIYELDSSKANKSDVYTKTEIDNSLGVIENDISTLFSTKQDNLIAGDNITIVDNVISTPDETDPIFNAWETLHQQYLNALLVETPDNPVNKYLNAMREWVYIVVGGGGYQSPLYFTTEDSITPGFRQIKYQPEVAETILSTPITSGITPLRSYIYDQPISISIIDSGNWVGSIECKLNEIKGTTRIIVEPFLYHLNGEKTILFTTYTDNLTYTNYHTYKQEVPIGTINCLPTDRLGFDFYIETDSNTQLIFSAAIGDGHPSYMVTPLRTRHSQLRDFNGDNNYLHITKQFQEEIEATINAVSGVQPPTNEKIDCLLYDSGVSSIEGSYYIDLINNKLYLGIAGGAYEEQIPSIDIMYIYDAESYSWDESVFTEITNGVLFMQSEYLPLSNIPDNLTHQGEMNGVKVDDIIVDEESKDVVLYDFKNDSGIKYVIPLLRSEVTSNVHKKLSFSPYQVEGVSALNILDEDKERLVYLKLYFVLVDSYTDSYNLNDVFELTDVIREGEDSIYYPTVGELAHKWLTVNMHFINGEPINIITYLDNYHNYRRAKTIDENSTDWEVPTAKAVYTGLSTKAEKELVISELTVTDNATSIIGNESDLYYITSSVNTNITINPTDAINKVVNLITYADSADVILEFALDTSATDWVLLQDYNITFKVLSGTYGEYSLLYSNELLGGKKIIRLTSSDANNNITSIIDDLSSDIAQNTQAISEVTLTISDIMPLIYAGL